jgi:(E)-4-hydroxy-3-methylbut-2-enyl-diphosphate synthase
MTLPEVAYDRRKTRPVHVGEIIIGGDHPIVVQSMITEETHNVPAAVAQIIAMHQAGAEIVRVTTPNMAEARCLAEIKARLLREYQDVPLVADVHHQGSDIAVEVAKYVDKVRINPGLFVFRKRVQRTVDYSEAEIAEELEAIERELLPVIRACKERDIAMRIGVNHGSLAERLTVMYGDTPEGMVESAIEYIQICERHDFRNLVLSLKASRVLVMLQANRLVSRRMAELGMDYPLHLGVTEAGDGMYARIKSTTGIGTLLAEGIGDTIRVSLAEDPVAELPVCYDILQALGLRRTKTEFIACPSCGRTKFDLPTVLAQVKAATGHLAGLNVAVMGCLPPGETVMTERGFAPIEWLQAGDRVLTHEGGFEEVTAVDVHPYEGELVEIVARGAPPVRMTPNHPVYALTRSSRVTTDRTRWENVADLVDRADEPAWYAADQITRDHVLLCPIVQGEYDLCAVPEDTALLLDERFLTLAACYAAEGSIGGTQGRTHQIFLSFGIHEMELAEEARAILCGFGSSVSLRVRADRNTCEVIAHCSHLAGLMARLFGRRAENKRLPAWMLTLPKDRQRTLLRTLWQCDGYVGVVNGYPRATYVTVSAALASAVHQLLLRQGIPARLGSRDPANRQRVYSVNVTSADGLRRFSQALGVPISLPDRRTGTGRLGLDDRYLYLPVLGTRRVAYAGPVHNLDVARAHTYVSALCLVHNCIVNGPGEMADADYGYVGKAGGKISLYRGREEVKTGIPQERGVEELIALIRDDGRWQEPPEGYTPPEPPQSFHDRITVGIPLAVK